MTLASAYAAGDTVKADSQQKTQQKTDTAHKKADVASVKRTIPWPGEVVSGWDWALVWSPVVFFIVSVLAINSRTKDFKLQDALTENQYPLITQQNPMYTITNLAMIPALPALAPLIPPTINVSETTNGLPKSSSRYLALLTTALTLIIAACLSSVFIYIYISSGTEPSFDHLGDILLALGYRCYAICL